MEVKINREIRNYTESMFFGLSMRQCVFGAAPFAAMGFVTYHGMTAEQFVWAWLRSEVLEPKVIRFQSNNIYYEALKPELEKKEKEGMKNHD